MGPISEMDMVRLQSYSACVICIKHATQITSIFNHNYFHVQSYSMDCYFRQSWVDKRLSFSGYKVTFDDLFHILLWLLSICFTYFCSEFISVFRMPLLFLLRCCERYGSQVINNSDDSFNLTCLEILQLAKDKFLSTDKICFRKVIEMMEFGWLLVDLNCHIKYQPSSLKATPVLGTHLLKLF